MSASQVPSSEDIEKLVADIEKLPPAYLPVIASLLHQLLPEARSYLIFAVLLLGSVTLNTHRARQMSKSDRRKNNPI